MRRIQPHDSSTRHRILIGLEWAHAKSICFRCRQHPAFLKSDDIRLLLRSLDHCLATCTKTAAGGKDAPCEDCDRARSLHQRLSKLSSP